MEEAQVGRTQPREEKVEEVVGLLKALADANRVKVIHALSQAPELCVYDVAAAIGSTPATASYHLRLLHHLRLVQSRKEGKQVYYRLDRHVQNLVREVLNHLAETD